jgi:DNA-binding MarR family transcriptional regulator
MNQFAPPAVALQFIGALQAVAERLDAALTPVGLSLAKFRVLSQLVAAGEPLALGTLAENVACVRSNITQLIDRLEADKLVVRVADPRDRRSTRAELTAEGRQRHAQGVRALEAAEEELLSRIPGADRERFLKVLSLIQQQA